MLSCLIGAIEGCDAATADILGAFLHTDYNRGDINVNMEVVMITLLEYIDLAYYKVFIYLYNRGRKCMYAEERKAIYGTL